MIPTRSGTPSIRIRHVFAFIILALVMIHAFSAPPARAAVTISSFRAQAQGNQIRVTWTTATENNNAGFNILRSNSAGGGYAKIGGLIPSQECLGCIIGIDYSYTDSAAATGQTYYYKLQSVDRFGGTENFGPVSAMIGGATATSTATKTQTPVKSSTPTATFFPSTASATVTLVPGTATATIGPVTATPTLIPGMPTPTRTQTGVATPLGSSTSSPRTKVAVAVGSSSTSTPVINSAANLPVPTATVTLDQIAFAAPTDTTGSQGSEDNAQEQRPAAPSWDATLATALVGVSGALGCGSLLFGSLAFVLLVRASRRRIR